MDVKSFNSKIECRDLKKCGEIATLLSSEKPEFFLNCGFCDYTFLQLENFIRHIYEDHILEFSQLELKQEEDIKEFEEEEAVFQTENRDNSFVFKDFERVEIELDTRIDPCIEIKNATPNEFMDEELLDNTKTEESYDFDFFGKREEPRRPSDTTSNRQQTNKKKCDWSEMEQSNNNKNYEDSDLEDDYTEGPSKGGTQCAGTIKMETPVKQRRKRSFWNSRAEACFVELWGEKVDELRGARKNTHVYQEMSSELAKQGCFLSAQDVKYKIANLTAKYRKCKEAMAPSGGSPASWNLYEAVHKVIGAQSINNVNMCAKESIECNSQETNEFAPLGVSVPSPPSWTEEFASASPLSSTELAWPSPHSERASSSNVHATRKATSKSTIKNSTETTIPRSCLEDAQYELLADIYKNYTCLWDENEIAYRFKNRRDEALKTLHLEVNERAGLDLTKHEMEYEITRLRRFCSVEKKKKVLCKRKQQRYEPTCSFHKSIVYLEVDVPPFECSECGKLLPGLGQYKVHLASHDGSLPFKCHLCGHGFQLVSNLTVHLRRHVHDYIYKCEICDKPCATSTEIKIHMRSHTGEKPFICSICGQGSRTSSHLLVHMLRHQKRPRYQCKLCPKMFYETGTLHEHMAVHRNIRDQICSVCNKGFTSGKQLRQHQLIHNAEKKYSCKLCGKRFAQFAGLSGHMKSHGTKLATTVRGSNFFNSE
ncbi:PREDICTED: myoneurin-like isoform X3 [Rhagoletis zephyria]|uniref:myoneurin-like isoform X3 n=1 Tax=Rhagoletis zephyria TaxID=28612 RepID=UPI0008112218|nr:PREDICTED: myoneurin-like isoform X3 [Rhagoletis zephyria]